MKKRFVALLTAVMTVASLSACGNSGGDYAAAPASTSDAVCYEPMALDGNAAEFEYAYEMNNLIAENGEVNEEFNTEEYLSIKENGFVLVSDNPLSTFSADVDTGSYCNLRRIINDGWSLDNVASSVRTEEIINYFDYDVNDRSDVFSVQYEVGNCPWNEEHKLLVMTFQANADEEVTNEGNNFVFLIDSSGSMSSPDKLALAVESFKMLAESLGKNDRVSIVTYSGDSRLLLEGSNDYTEICRALDKISAGGGTNGSGGISAAYECANNNFIKGGNNRVIIASDGDMNLGITSTGGLTDLITEEKESGVFLTVLGFGSGNYSDANMESIADAGNGNYYYIDTIDEARRVLVDKLKQTTLTVAKDVKFQAEFNPAVVYSYRQIGYENRVMSASDFNDDTKDGGEVGAGQQVTIAYEIELAGTQEEGINLKYQDSEVVEGFENELCTVAVRYKEPDADESSKLTYVVEMGEGEDEVRSEDFNFVAGIIEASMVIRDSDYTGSATLDSAYILANSGTKGDEYRIEFCDLLVELGAHD
ncbi:MAG: von Willebrand factor type A domain-containing protein [Lachnospiraceae bacterium]|nr:von Willebrand factor type A domain-containing protein [Lachnospiraceae bacterium]